MADDLDRQLNAVLPEPNPFAMDAEGLFAYWQATVDHLYNVLKGKRKAELRGQSWRGWTAEGAHDPSAALGRLQAVEMLMPDLRALWHIGRNGEYASALKIAGLEAREDAEQEWRNEV